MADTYDSDQVSSFIENWGVSDRYRTMSSISTFEREVSLPTVSCIERSHNVRRGPHVLHRNGNIYDVTANDFVSSPSVKLFRKRIPVNNLTIRQRRNNGHFCSDKHLCPEINVIFCSLGDVSRHWSV